MCVCVRACVYVCVCACIIVNDMHKHILFCGILSGKTIYSQNQIKIYRKPKLLLEARFMMCMHPLINEFTIIIVDNKHHSEKEC